MSPRKYFGTDGIRGLVGQAPITPDFVLKLGWAAGKVLAKDNQDTIILGKDTRISGYMLESALEAGFAAAGLTTYFVGPMPTPAVAYLTRTLRAAAGVVISASHNPFYDNGVKFFSSSGTKLGDDVELAIEELLDQPVTCVESAKLGRARRIVDAAGRYIEFCKSTFPNKYSLKGLKIVVDCANGATYHIAPSVLQELGAEVISINVQPNGLNINLNCGATDVAELQKTVVETNSDIGLAYDGDGDRLMMVDHKGNLVDGDQILFIIAYAAYQANKLDGGVVGTVMSNMGIEVALNNLNIPFLRSNVGDRYVIELMQKHGWNFGGESSGHIIIANRNTTGDGIVSSLAVLTAMVAQGKSLYDLNQNLELFPQTLINVTFTGSTNPLATTEVKNLIQDIEQKLKGHGRLLVRKSGTEPLIRIMVECMHADVAEKYAQEIAAMIKNNQ